MAAPDPSQYGLYRLRAIGTDAGGNVLYSSMRIEPDVDIQPGDIIQATPFVPTIRRKRPLLDIITALNALAGTQKTNVWSDITSGSPPKWATDAGPNAAAIAVMQFVATTSTLNATDILNAKIRGVAMYCQDNPTYLVAPAFDPTINVPGDQ